jgi:hypothetical protein
LDQLELRQLNRLRLFVYMPNAIPTMQTSASKTPSRNARSGAEHRLVASFLYMGSPTKMADAILKKLRLHPAPRGGRMTRTISTG